MTTFYRLVKPRYSTSPFDGEGARRFGGRWNSHGVAVAYASSSVSLAALEVLVHLQNQEILRTFVLCSIALSERSIETLETDRLPSDWRSEPASQSTKTIGDTWVESGSSMALRVPSTVVPVETNILLNPTHRRFRKAVLTVQTQDFEFDPRLHAVP
ncbi:MAG: RES domain-containing protein [Myxococcota bacterium]